LANALTGYGVRHGQYVVLWCRNHAALLESVIACGKLGAHALILNTDLPPAQVNEALRRYHPVVMLVDDEFAAPGPGSPALVRIRTWGAGKPTVEDLVERGAPKPVEEPPTTGKITVLTSGGTKGTRRRNPHALRPIAAVLSRIPLRAGERTLVAAPLFYSWAGLAAIQLGMPLHARLVLQRHFDAEETLRLVQEHRCTSLFTTPAVLAQILALPPRVIRKYDTRSLRVVATSGPALLPELVTEFMDEFGEVLYHLYGSAELSWVSIADPNQLRAAPTTAGRPPAGTRIEIQDTWGRPVPPGVIGQICVGDDVFGGYGGRNPGELLRTGDRGYVDADGRLFVATRTDTVAPRQPGPAGAAAANVATGGGRGGGNGFRPAGRPTPDRVRGPTPGRDPDGGGGTRLPQHPTTRPEGPPRRDLHRLPGPHDHHQGDAPAPQHPQSGRLANTPSGDGRAGTFAATTRSGNTNRASDPVGTDSRCFGP
jgi:acyl-coenzyme A synthetase/AMP-(fatty) acid ligase